MRVLALAAALACAPGLAFGDVGTTGAATLSRPFGARALGMARAFAGVPGGLESADYNPAGLIGAKRPALSTSYSRGLINDSFGYVGYAQPVRSLVLDAGLLYYDAGTIHLNLSDGTNSSVDAEQDYVGMVGGAVPLPLGFSVGGIAKVYRFQLAQQATAAGFAGDLGALWRSPVAGLSLGAALQNAGPDVKFEQEGDPLPLTERVGAAYALDTNKLGWTNGMPYAISQYLFTADLVQTRGQPVGAAVGVELALPLADGRIALRGGYVVNSSADSASAGIGFKEGRFIFDYALGIMKTLSDTQNLAIGVEF